ncbi:cytochrome c oxidase assembly protein [Luteimicrobium sp. DT211]|uniref:cytochrome c oxidase assembly protein n=1 Tax=Luteimicrobium sp. DT211 TaxID=3393412 RepID=UPI003CFB000A
MQPPDPDDPLGAPAPPPRPLPPGAVLAAAVPLGLVALLVALSFTGALQGVSVLDAGPVVDVGLPVARTLQDGAAALTIGFLVLAATAIPGARSGSRTIGRSQWVATRWAVRAGVVWLVALLANLVLEAADIMGVPLTSPGFAHQVVFLALHVELGQTLLVSSTLVALALVVLLASRRTTAVAIATALALGALLPLALGGHAAGSAEHGNAVNALAVHLLGVTVWLGGLVALILLRGTLGRSLPVVARRYSTLAGIAFVAVAASGVVNAWLRLQSPADLVTTAYGALILVKVLALTALGVAGWQQRRRALPALDDGHRGAFLRLALVESLVMAVTLGVSVALSRSAPPVAQNPISGDARHELLGFPYPPHVTPLRMLTEFHLDWAFAALALAMAGLYVAAVVRLRRRGDSWSTGRTAAWLLGCLLLLYCTSGGPAVYGSVQFSTHMILHMGLMMFVPLPLVLGAPVLLALRVLPSRGDHSRGPREWILLGVHSWYARLLARPAVAGVIFAGSLVAFYFTGWFQAALFDHPVHVLMQVHFLLSGYLFFWLLVGADPGPARPEPPMRLVVLLITLTFHAFFGIALMSTDALIAADWWHAMGYTNDAALLADQHSAGGIAWGAGEFPTFIAAVIVAMQWQASDKREARRKDRQADRDGDAELVAYNAELAALARRDAALDRRG